MKAKTADTNAHLLPFFLSAERVFFEIKYELTAGKPSTKAITRKPAKLFTITEIYPIGLSDNT
jgi:hypothetical protein